MVDSDVTPGEATGWKQALSRWLFSQGASTVLLFMIMLGLYVEVPKIVAAVTASYEKINADNAANIQAIHSAHSTQLKSLSDTFQEERSRERELTKEAVDAIKQLTLEIRNQRSVSKVP